MTNHNNVFDSVTIGGQRGPARESISAVSDIPGQLETSPAHAQSLQRWKGT